MQERMVSHYKVLECLGGGAMGQVFKAEDTLLHRQVALKFLPAELTEDDEASRRFMREARATSGLDHPNICSIHEISQAPDGSWFIAMTLYEGQTLKKILRQGPLDPELALKYARQIALGLNEAHDHGVVHRDIKPDNIIITNRGDVKILDFGLARLMGKARLTRTGTVMGTAAYMSPEQARGDDVGPSSDIWSLGVVLYEMLSGKVPFEGDSDVAMIYTVLHSDPAPLPAPVCRNSKICNDIIQHCLARNPKDRYPSAQVLADDIERAMEGSKTSFGSRSSGSSIFAPPEKPRWRRLLPAILALVLLVGLAVPQSRRLLRSAVPFLAAEKPAGVAVVPFLVSGDEDDAGAFGLGLSSLVNDRLSGLEQYSDRFWVVPLAEIQRREIADSEQARAVLGARRIISATGNISGNNITLTLRLHDTGDGSYETRQFQDFAGNLKTWQSDVLSWLAAVIDPELGPTPDRLAARHATNVPRSFLDFMKGLGHLEDAAAGSPDRRAAAALPYLERAVASDSSYACAWAQMGRAVFLRYGTGDSVRVAQAEDYFTTAALLDTTAVEPHFFRGEIAYRLGEYESALDHYREVLARDPVHAQALAQIGNLHARAGNDRLAEAAFARAIEARPYFSRAYRDAGVFNYGREDMEKARGNFQHMVDLAPGDELGYRLLGIAYFGEGDYPNAEAMLERSLDLKSSGYAYANLGVLYFYDQRYTDSIAMSREALDYYPDDYATWRTLAAAYEFAPGYEDSVQPAFEKALDLLRLKLAQDPANMEYKADLASFLTILGSPDKATSILEEMEADPAGVDPQTMFSLASTYERLGNRDRALDWLEKAMSRELSFKKVDHYPVLKNLQSHPRYIALRKKYGE